MIALSLGLSLGLNAFLFLAVRWAVRKRRQIEDTELMVTIKHDGIEQVMVRCPLNGLVQGALDGAGEIIGGGRRAHECTVNGSLKVWLQ